MTLASPCLVVVLIQVILWEGKVMNELKDGLVLLAGIVVTAILVAGRLPAAASKLERREHRGDQHKY
jgi:hypothetical protein